MYKEGSSLPSSDVKTVKISEEMRKALGMLSKEPVTDEEIEQERLQLLNLKTSMDNDIYQDTLDEDSSSLDDIELENCYPIYEMIKSLKLEVKKNANSLIFQLFLKYFLQFNVNSCDI